MTKLEDNKTRLLKCNLDLELLKKEHELDMNEQISTLNTNLVEEKKQIGEW